jgi:hypothetical protein
LREIGARGTDEERVRKRKRLGEGEKSLQWSKTYLTSQEERK